MNSLISNTKSILRPLYNLLKISKLKILDFLDSVKGKRNPIIPPRHLIFIGDGDFEKTGEEFLKYFINFGELKSDARVLDIGCGIGRMAIPLTKFLSPKGEYHGFDIVNKGIDWCQKKITPLFPNFHFLHSNVYNKMYNPEGKEKSNRYNFEYSDSYFDFVFLTSVFTHMQSEEMSHYVHEISRVLKVGGKCLITFFILNEESFDLIKSGKSTQDLHFQIDNHSFTIDVKVPERAIGFREDYIKEILKMNSLKLIEPIYYGSWCGREKYTSYQDFLIAEKI